MNTYKPKESKLFLPGVILGVQKMFREGSISANNFLMIILPVMICHGHLNRIRGHQRCMKVVKSSIIQHLQKVASVTYRRAAMSKLLSKLSNPASPTKKYTKYPANPTQIALAPTI